MKQTEAYDLIVREYLDVVECCDRCTAQHYCIRHNLRDSRIPQPKCVKNLKDYLRDK